MNPDLAPPDRPLQNPLGVDEHGQPIWQAPLPPATPSDWHDRYVEICWDGPHLAAHTWSGWYVLIDPETGDIQAQEFTK